MKLLFAAVIYVSAINAFNSHYRKKSQSTAETEGGSLCCYEQLMQCSGALLIAIALTMFPTAKEIVEAFRAGVGESL